MHTRPFPHFRFIILALALAALAFTLYVIGARLGGGATDAGSLVWIGGVVAAIGALGTVGSHLVFYDIQRP